MSLEKPTIVIFDMDGTTVRHLSPRLLNTMEQLDDTAYRVTKFFGWVFKRKGRGPILPVEETAARQRKEPRLLVHRAIHRVRRKPVEQIVEPCPGIYPVLKFLQEKEVPMAIVSNGLGKGYGHEILKKFNFEQYFKASVFREDIKNSKPNPEPLLLALRELGVKLKEDDVIWYIGDRHKDVTASLAAQKHLPCKIQPIAYGVNAAAAIIEKGIGTEHILINYSEIYARLSSLFRRAEAKEHNEKFQNENDGLLQDVKKLIRSMAAS